MNKANLYSKNENLTSTVGAGLVPARETHGITLMTLIITIVIMLIIAGVTIGITADGDGLADKAQEQVEKTNNRIAKEDEIVSGIIDDIKDELKVDVSGVVLDTTNVTLKIGDTKTITATVVPQNSPNKAVTWSSSDSSVATVNNGLITAIKAGTAIITATTQEGNESASCTVTVGESVQGVTLNSNSITIAKGNTQSLTATITPENAVNKNVVWSSSNPQVATVDANGLVTAVNGGIAVITVTTQDGNKTASCIVKVNPFDTTKVPDVVIESSTIAGVNKQRIAPIPAGYTASKVSTEDEIKEGLVIYQTGTGETEVTSANHATALTTRNQYVWIPVDDINDMVMCKSNGQEGAGGKTICELDYNVTTPNEITCRTHNYTTSTPLTKGIIDTVGLAGRTYGGDPENTPDANGAYTASMDFTQKNQTFTKDTDYREPDILTNTSYADGVNSYLTGIGIVVPEGEKSGTTLQDVFKEQLNADFIAMAKSVAKYGGFYIARYEAGANGASKKNQKVLTAVDDVANAYTSEMLPGSNPDTVLASNMWYGLYRILRSETGVDTTKLGSHMVWGCQYDQVIKFIGNEAQKGNPGKVTGNQSNTGYENDADILNNIYDLEGNNIEWTSQANYTVSRVFRGGGCFYISYDSRFNPVSYRYYDLPSYTHSYYTSRSTLYVKWD